MAGAPMLAVSGLALMTGGMILPLALLWRLRQLTPSPVGFIDVESAELWQRLADQRAVIILTESLDEARATWLDNDREVWAADGPRIFVHFGLDRTTRLRSSGSAIAVRGT